MKIQFMTAIVLVAAMPARAGWPLTAATGAAKTAARATAAEAALELVKRTLSVDSLQQKYTEIHFPIQESANTAGISAAARKTKVDLNRTVLSGAKVHPDGSVDLRVYETIVEDGATSGNIRSIRFESIGAYNQALPPGSPSRLPEVQFPLELYEVTSRRLNAADVQQAFRGWVGSRSGAFDFRLEGVQVDPFGRVHVQGSFRTNPQTTERERILETLDSVEKYNDRLAPGNPLRIELPQVVERELKRQLAITESRLEELRGRLRSIKETGSEVSGTTQKPLSGADANASTEVQSGTATKAVK